MKNPLKIIFNQRVKDFFNPPFTQPTLNGEPSPKGLTMAEFMLLTGMSRQDQALVETALKRGADPNVREGEPLIRAAAHHAPALAKTLVLAGADIGLAMRTANERLTVPDARGIHETYSLTNLYGFAGNWLKNNRAELLQHYIDVKLPALEAQNEELRSQIATLRDPGSNSAPPNPDGKRPGLML